MTAPQAIHTDSVSLPRGHYSQAVRIGSLVFVSGQLPLDREGKTVRATVAAELNQALANVRSSVEAAGGTLATIVQCTVYISDISLWAEVNEAYGAFFDSVPVLPARTIVPVKDLHNGARIEIQAVAVLNDGKTIAAVHHS
jgi:2-iminobutanoate/2-iminopropanoate deaminase